MTAEEYIEQNAERLGSRRGIRLPREANAMWRIVWAFVWCIHWFFVRFVVIGEEKLPRSGGAIVACNHNPYLDFVMLGFCSPRQLFYMAKSEIFEINPLLTKVLFAVGTFPVDRGSRDAGAINHAKRILLEGQPLGMFPEGTRSRDGKLQRGKSGVSRLALEAKVPVVPAVVINSEKVLSTFLTFRRRPVVYVVFGEPIIPEGDPNSPLALRTLTRKMMVGIAELLPPERRGYYATPHAVAREEEESASSSITAEKK